jgi:phage I-like protein
MPRALEDHGGAFDDVLRFEIVETDEGWVRVRLLPAGRLRSFYGHERDVAAFLYAFAVEVELRSKSRGARWDVTVDGRQRTLDIEAANEEEFDDARHLLQHMIEDLALERLVAR